MSCNIVPNTQNNVSTPTVSTPAAVEPVAYFTPLVDIVETPEAFIFQADLPGVKAEGLDITYDNEMLTIEGKIQSSTGQKYLLQEYGVGNFYRQFTFNTPVNSEAIRADFKEGVLELHVPKAETAKTRKITVRSA